MHRSMRALALVLAGLLMTSAADARPSCRRLCREAVEDCRFLAFQQSGARRSGCRKTILRQCRRDDGATCSAARQRARLCEAQCDEAWRACITAPQSSCGSFETSCRTSDAGLAVCQEATARFAECQSACAPIASSCLGARDLQACSAFVDAQCRGIGPDYCRAPDTANGCNRLVARDLRGESAVSLESDCILVSRGAVVDVGDRKIVSSLDDFCAKGEADLYDADCFAVLLYAIVGGNAPTPDPRSPFVAAIGTDSVRFDAPGTHGYWGVGGRWGAVIVDDQ